MNFNRIVHSVPNSCSQAAIISTELYIPFPTECMIPLHTQLPMGPYGLPRSNRIPFIPLLSNLAPTEFPLFRCYQTAVKWCNRFSCDLLHRRCPAAAEGSPAATERQFLFATERQFPLQAALLRHSVSNRMSRARVH